MERVIRVFSSFKEADQADEAYYSALSSQQRLNIALELIARQRENQGEASQRFERVYRVVERPRR